jgi:predicted ester cyclase
MEETEMSLGTAVDVKDVVRIVFSGFNSRNLDQVAGIVTDDFELEDIPAGLVLRGPEGMKAWLGNWVTAAPDAYADLRWIIADGDWVATEHFGTATHTGPPQTPNGVLPATGGKIELWFAENYQMRDGKIAKMRVFYDGAAVLRQLGLLQG